MPCPPPASSCRRCRRSPIPLRHRPMPNRRRPRPPCPLPRRHRAVPIPRFGSSRRCRAILIASLVMLRPSARKPRWPRQRHPACPPARGRPNRRFAWQSLRHRWPRHWQLRRRPPQRPTLPTPFGRPPRRRRLSSRLPRHRLSHRRARRPTRRHRSPHRCPSRATCSPHPATRRLTSRQAKPTNRERSRGRRTVVRVVNRTADSAWCRNEKTGRESGFFFVPGIRYRRSAYRTALNCRRDGWACRSGHARSSDAQG